MPEHQDVRPDGTVAFLPHRLNRHPVVVRGLTADELWVCAGLSGAAGLSVGIPLAIIFSMIAIAPTAIVLGIAAGVLPAVACCAARNAAGPTRGFTGRSMVDSTTASGHCPVRRRAGPGDPFGLLDNRGGGPPHEPVQERDHPSAGAYQDPARPGAGALLLVALVMGIGWWNAPRDLTIHVPPDLRSGSTRKWWEVPPESVYSFSFYIWQQLQRWPVNGDEDYSRNIHVLSPYFTPSCQSFLRHDYEYRRTAGELRQRVRGIYEIPGRGYGEDPTLRVKAVSDRDWIVTLDVTADEYYGSEQVKRALVRYPSRSCARMSIRNATRSVWPSTATAARRSVSPP